MDENELFIEGKVLSLVLECPVKAKMLEIGGVWDLHVIHYVRPMLRNIDFSLILENGTQRCIRVSAKINRASGKFSNIKAEEMIST